eukprot:scaffold154272_cov32-Tisochrysis_lutea.AAC.3
MPFKSMGSCIDWEAVQGCERQPAFIKGLSRGVECHLGGRLGRRLWHERANLLKELFRFAWLRPRILRPGLGSRLLGILLGCLEHTAGVAAEPDLELVAWRFGQRVEVGGDDVRPMPQPRRAAQLRHRRECGVDSGKRQPEEAKRPHGGAAPDAAEIQVGDIFLITETRGRAGRRDGRSTRVVFDCPRC